MKRSKFTKPPLTALEKEKKAEEFLNFTPVREVKVNSTEQKPQERVLKKEGVKLFVLRFPKSLAEDLAEISAKSGLSMNAICIHLLRSAVKQKLKEVKE